MKVNLNAPLKSSFLSCEKDAELIIRRLFVDHPQHANVLKRLLVINAKDCLDNMESEVYKQKVQEATVQKLINDQYITLTPKIYREEHPEVKSYIVLNFDNFTPNDTNPEFRDCTVHFDIFCYTDCWDLGNYRLRPLKIAGYIDGLLDKTHLSGIGQFNFLTCAEITLDENISGYSLMYRAVHGSDDKIEATEE